MKKKKYYALYKGDKFLDIGTLEELASLLDVKKRTINFYSTPTYIKRNAKGNNYVVVKIEDVDDNEPIVYRI